MGGGGDRTGGRHGVRVTVLLPARDAAGTLSAALASVRRQDVADWECVVVDDGSRDDTAAIAARAAAMDRRFRLLRRPRKGLVAALRAGLAAARGAFVARMDADDLMHPRRLGWQLRVLEADPGLAGVGGHVRLFPRHALGPGIREYAAWLSSVRTPEDVGREAFVECPLVHPTLCLHRKVLEGVGGWQDRDWPEDYDLVLRLLAAGHRLGVVPRPVLAWRRSPDSLQRRDPRYGLDRFTACKAWYLARGFLKSREDYVLWGYGQTGRSLCRALARHGLRPSHVVEVHPRRLGRQIQGAPVVPPEELLRLAPPRVVVSVAGTGPRETIRAWLRRHGFRELQDFVCAA